MLLFILECSYFRVRTSEPPLIQHTRTYIPRILPFTGNVIEKTTPLRESPRCVFENCTTWLAFSFLDGIPTKHGRCNYNKKRKKHVIIASVIFLSFFLEIILENIFNIRQIIRQECTRRIIAASHSRDTFPGKYPKRKDARSFALDISHSRKGTGKHPISEDGYQTSYY